MSCIDTLRLSEAQRAGLLRMLEEHNQQRVYVNLRQDARHPYDPAEPAVLKLFHPGGSMGEYAVRPHNLSRGGTAFLHGAYIHAGSQTRLRLKTRWNESRTVDGQVVWCRHVSSRIHEIGIKFESPIEIAEYIGDASPAQNGPAGDEEEAIGRLLAVEQCPEDQELLKFHLDQLGLKLTSASEALEAVELAGRERFELIAADAWLSGMSGLELVESLRSSGYDGPVLVLTADDRECSREEAFSRGATDVMVKPYSLQRLSLTLRKHLPRLGGQDQPIYSDHWANPRMRPLVMAFLRQLDQRVRSLRGLAEDGSQPELFRRQCLALKGSAGGYGYPTLTESAQRLHEAAAEGRPDRIKQRMNEVTALCTAATRALPQDSGQAD